MLPMPARFNFIALNQLTRDTFRQACASGICWMMLAVTAICVVLCLSVNVSGDVTLHAEDEPALFLPRTSEGTASTRAAAIEKTGASVETDPELARREG